MSIFTTPRAEQPQAWKKGCKPPNPSGRPKVDREMRDLARQHGAEVIEKLMDILRDTEQKTADRIYAGEVILDRGFGKPMQSLQADVTVRPQIVPMPVELTVADLEAMYKSQPALIDITPGTPKDPEPSVPQTKTPQLDALKTRIRQRLGKDKT